MQGHLSGTSPEEPGPPRFHFDTEQGKAWPPIENPDMAQPKPELYGECKSSFVYMCNYVKLCIIRGVGREQRKVIEILNYRCLFCNTGRLGSSKHF